MLKSAATKLAHSTTLPVLGNRELKPLQDLIIAEKTVLVSLQKLSSDLSKASDTLKIWASNEEEELEDILGASSKLLNQFSVALYQYSSYQHPMREHMKAVRDREEVLEELKRRRRALLTRSETLNRKVSKLSSANRSGKPKNLAGQTDLANQTRKQIDAMNEDIINEEAALRDFKRRKARAWMEIKFGGLLECCEKGSVACDFGKLIINEISDKHSQPGLPSLPYTKQAKIQSVLQAALQRGDAVAFTSFSLESNPKEFVSGSKANSVSATYEENEERTKPQSPSHNLYPTIHNESAASLTGLSSDSVPSSDNLPTHNSSLERPLQPYSSHPISDLPSQQQNSVVAIDTGSNDLSGYSSTSELKEIVVVSTDLEPTGLRKELNPATIHTASSEDNKQTTSPIIATGSTRGGRGGRFAAFPVKRRIPPTTDRSVAQSVYDSSQSFLPQDANPPRAGSNSVIYTAHDATPLGSLKEDESVGKEENETLEASASLSRSLIIDKPVTDQSTSSTGSVLESPSLGFRAQTLEEGIELDIPYTPSTPRPHLPSPRFSSHFTTNAYFEVLSQRQAEEPPPPLPALPLSTSNRVNAVAHQASVSFASGNPLREQVSDENETNTLWVEPLNDSDPSTPRAFTSSVLMPVLSPKSPLVGSSEAGENNALWSKTLHPGTSQGSSPLTSVSEPPMFEPLEPPPTVPSSSVLELSPETKSELPFSRPTEFPETILAPFPINPNRVRFASNPVEIPHVRLRDSWDSLFTDSEENEKMSFQDMNGVGPAVSDDLSEASFASVNSASESVSRDVVMSDAVYVPSPPGGTTGQISESSLASNASYISSEKKILDLLNATTAKASSILAKLESDSPSPSPSASSSLPRFFDATGSSSFSSPSSTPSPLPKPLTRSNTSGGSFATALSSVSATTQKFSSSSSSLEDMSSIRTVSPLTGHIAIERNRVAVKKPLPSSPYPQRRIAKSPSLSRSASANAVAPSASNARGSSYSSLSRSSSANATVPSGTFI
ncbi:hypothetical protein J3R30DRAFT_3546850 [Lentinula aciculospora]|uniref:Uncharacterized protein n=1 Tax=Lentinula aciculospora TaxID=153920 RepID=A0A9W8ZXW9_9AGAR|nr:hypothetical protein J3R30DRAFT_3546850 [Lentinula aciculospora]